MQTCAKLTAFAAVALAILLGGSRRAAFGQAQRSDPDFDPKVERPAYPSDGPKVLFDEAHNNFHTADGRYKPFADLIRNDGFQITPNKDPFTAERLAGCDVLLIANALGSPQQSGPAFTDAECDAVRDWIKGGGALLLITDHFPMGLAARSLARRFDVQMSGGYTANYTFEEGEGLAGPHPILRGRSEEEAIRVLRSFTGQSIKGPEGGVTLMRQPDGAEQLMPDAEDPLDQAKAKRIPSLYPDQGVAFRFGQGRVVVLGEAGMLSAQVSPSGRKFGMNVPGTDNRQFGLNVMHWLAGLLPAE